MSISDLEKRALEAKSAHVMVGNDKAGILQMLATDEYSFDYDQDYIQKQGRPISLAMPLQTESYLCETLHPFFDNLLFEGEQLKSAERKYGLNRRSYIDRFRLLMVTGFTNLSQVSVMPLIDGKPRNLTTEVPIEAEFPSKLISLKSAYMDSCPVCLKSMENSTHKNCRRALWATVSEISLEAFQRDPSNIFRAIAAGQSISGAQRKALFSLQKKTLRKQGPGTHILKPSGDFPEMPANEHLTMIVAKEQAKQFDWN